MCIAIENFNGPGVVVWGCNGGNNEEFTYNAATGSLCCKGLCRLCDNPRPSITNCTLILRTRINDDSTIDAIVHKPTQPLPLQKGVAAISLIAWMLPKPRLAVVAAVATIFW